MDDFLGSEATLEQVLQSREKRSRHVMTVCPLHECTVCVTVNMMGPVKKSPAVCEFIKNGLSVLLKLTGNPDLCETVDDNAGPYTVLCFEKSPAGIKENAIDAEESKTWMRMIDIDVFDRQGKKLERINPRKCIVCNKEAFECSSRRAHSLEEMYEKVGELYRCMKSEN